MAILPLVLSAHPSAWNPAGILGWVGEQVIPPDATCRFCVLDAAGWQEAFHLDGDHGNASPGNVVSACPLCHLCQHLDRPTLHEEAALIWLPELSQAAVIALARSAHLVLRAHGEPPHMDRGRPVRREATLAPAWAALHALRGRAGVARDRLGTASPLDLAAALLGIERAAPTRGPTLLNGLRLLPLGRLYQEGQDVYPQALHTWAWAAEAGCVLPASPFPDPA